MDDDVSEQRREDAGGIRKRVLVGAYACGPGAEPEASAGWEMVRAAARDHDVWVITRPRFEASISAALSDDPDLAERVHPVYLDLAPRIVRLKRRAWDLYWYYLLWQRALGRRAVELHARHAFDVAHHATFANDWMPSGLTALRDVPLVWGPVGGSSSVPIRRLAPWLGVRGTITELVRAVTTRPARLLGGDPTARRAALVVAQNPQVADHFRRRGARVVVEPNAALKDLPVRPAQVAPRKAVFAGRLLAWKGAALAIDTIARAGDDWSLDIFGEGYDEARLRARVAALGLDGRVQFRGHRPRPEVLEAIAGAQVFLFPSMHDQAGWVVAEASSMGCPTVCLPLGGPPVLAEPNAHVASLDGDIVGNLVEQLHRAAAAASRPTDRWQVERLPDVVSGWYRTALNRGGGLAPAEATDPPGRLTVLQSYRAPRATTNPYITQLHTSLSARTDTEVLPFGYRNALLGRYDVVHLHWPEIIMGGHRWTGRLARRALTVLVLLRWTFTRVAVVRTVHNLERPSGISRIDHLLLDWIDRRTCFDIRLNDQTPHRRRIPGATIAHGHYRDWFAAFPQSTAVRGRIGYAGLIRRYKGVEDLLTAFTRWDEASASLHVAGKPSSQDLVEQLERAARADARVTLDLRFLDEAELVDAITSAELIVLPYRHMHNSGTALAALSLDRPVLVPDNEVNRALADEVGAGWVHLFAGALDAATLERAWRDSTRRGSSPDLSARDWAPSAEAHRAAYRAARASRTRPRARRRGM